MEQTDSCQRGGEGKDWTKKVKALAKEHIGLAKKFITSFSVNKRDVFHFH